MELLKEHDISPVIIERIQDRIDNINYDIDKRLEDEDKN